MSSNNDIQKNKKIVNIDYSVLQFNRQLFWRCDSPERLKDNTILHIKTCDRYDTVLFSDVLIMIKQITSEQCLDKKKTVFRQPGLIIT